MASFLDFNVQDSARFPGKMRIPITPQSVPAAVTTYATNIVEAAFGTALPLFGGIMSVNLVIDGVVAPQIPIDNCDIRDKWVATLQDSNGENVRFTMPSRNLSTSLLAGGAGLLADLSDATWTALLAALEGSGTVHMVNSKTNADIGGWYPVLTGARSRKRPRVGGSR